MCTSQDPTKDPTRLTEWLAYPNPERREDQLRTKIHSKMTVATFLAGFTFTALIEVLSDSGSFSNISSTVLLLNNNNPGAAFGAMTTLLAAVSLALSLVLFIGTVYSYDKLAMPFHRWGSFEIEEGIGVMKASRTQIVFQVVSVSEKQQREEEINFALFQMMIRVWSNGFNWAVVFAAVGMAFMILRSGFPLLLACFLVVVAHGVYWVRKFVMPPISARD